MKSFVYLFAALATSALTLGCAKDFSTVYRDRSGEVVGQDRYKSGIGGEVGRREVRVDDYGRPIGYDRGLHYGGYDQGWRPPPTWEGNIGRVATPSEMNELEMKQEMFILRSQQGGPIPVSIYQPDERVDQLAEYAAEDAKKTEALRKKLEKLEAERNSKKEGK